MKILVTPGGMMLDQPAGWSVLGGSVQPYTYFEHSWLTTLDMNGLRLGHYGTKGKMWVQLHRG